MKTSGIRRWVFQLEVNGKVVEPREALSHLEKALTNIKTAQGDGVIWQVTERGDTVRAKSAYPPGGEMQLGAVAVNVHVKTHDFQGMATLLTINFKDNLNWSLPYAKVPINRAVQQKFFDDNLGYAETVFDTTTATAQEFLEGLYGKASVIGAEQDV